MMSMDTNEASFFETKVMNFSYQLKCHLTRETEVNKSGLESGILLQQFSEVKVS